ncbi:hypothetical protein [Leptolyngbya sp. 7M]|uniref:hypothetical protein n=1 Tax=Leptolyngbya sp. 7M TaxID=2812896 RepID=UPI001B8C7E0E|nr:hypothetical protein [Leptolyngbya sp. 7M]QYO64442.1 hypothetical protein JVX88_32975 [Leptolyngbya sp. 7M]
MTTFTGLTFGGQIWTPKFLQAIDKMQQEAEQANRNAISRLLAMGLSVEQVADVLGISIEEIEP